MRIKILMGLFALIASCFLWFTNDGLRTFIRKSDDLDKKIGNAGGTLSKTMLSFSNPLEAAHNRLALGMDRQEALNIVDEEYPINDNAKFYSVGRNANGAYVWRWEWKNEIDSGATESATLTITFTREGDCVMCKVSDAVYEYKLGVVIARKGLRADSPKI